MSGRRRTVATARPSATASPHHDAEHDPVSLLVRYADDPARTFLLFKDEEGRIHEVGYAEQARRAGATAALLAQLGVGPGDRVHLMTANCPEFLDVLFGAMSLGAVVVPANPLSSVDEVVHQLRDAGAAVSIVDRPRLEVAEQAARNAGGRPVLSIEELVARRPASATLPEGHRRGPAAIMYTSGTTSRPKGVLVSHENYVRVGRAMAGHLRMTAADRWLVVLPLFHANAQYYCLMSALVSGGSLALAPRFSATGWARQAREMRATLASLFAAPIRMILARSVADPADAANELRVVLFAQNLTRGQATDFETRFGAPLIQLYGMTETVLPPLINPLGEHRRWASVGQVLPGVAIRVLDPAGEPVAPGSPGELVIGGVPGVDITAGYHERPAETAALLRDGWLHTGDVVRLDEQGRAFFVDRVKDMIKRSGENIAAGEVERVLDEHPSVLESAVHGVPDPVHDEMIVAHVVTHAGRRVESGDLIAWCASHLPHFKVPGRVLLRPELPRTSVGKVRKDVLRAEAACTGSTDPDAPSGSEGGSAHDEHG